MREFRPESWQKQARKQGDALFDRVQNGTLDGERGLAYWFALGYNYFPMCKQRRKYVEQRAAKRVGRLIRKGNKK